MTRSADPDNFVGLTVIFMMGIWYAFLLASSTFTWANYLPGINSLLQSAFGVFLFWVGHLPFVGNFFSFLGVFFLPFTRRFNCTLSVLVIPFLRPCPILFFEPVGARFREVPFMPKVLKLISVAFSPSASIFGLFYAISDTHGETILA